MVEDETFRLYEALKLGAFILFERLFQHCHISGMNYGCKYLRVWTDVFHMWHPDACESFCPAMSVMIR